MHEATRSILGVLLRNLDGFALAGQCVITVIGATNRQVTRLITKRASLPTMMFLTLVYTFVMV